MIKKKTILTHGKTKDYWCAEGFAADFQPAGLPVPTHFIALHTNEPQPNEYFTEEWNKIHPHAILLIVKSDIETLKNTMCQFAQDPENIYRHLRYRNCGLYALWDYGDYQMIAGMDNSSDDVAQNVMLAMKSQFGPCALYFANCFRADYLERPDNFHFLDEKSKEFVTLYQAIKQRQILEVNTVSDKNAAQNKSKM